MEFQRTSIPEVILITPRVFGDQRGFFQETYHREKFREGGIEAAFVQDNHSRSTKGVLRGLHYQIRQPQGKLVRVLRGEIWDVAVDLRRSSPTFGKWVGVKLDDQNYQQLYVPPGFAHGFCVTSESADVAYKCTDLYLPEAERSLLWNDPALGIEWPVESPILSVKDQQGKLLSEAETFA
ncbi:MAG: dTDP-4-dehydrorhamnose 3,5-epimerase [Planctomycetaceae bacterium]|nr:dTDP-4-dehydrorhamnose 3,5-epimerase [Planctomycetaceae bacterium]